MEWNGMEYNTIQYNTIPYPAIPYPAIPFICATCAFHSVWAAAQIYTNPCTGHPAQAGLVRLAASVIHDKAQGRERVKERERERERVNV